MKPEIEHYPICDRDVYGRAVLALMDGAPEDITATNLRAWVRGYRHTAACGCLDLRISSYETRLERARKSFEACMSESNADAVAVLKAELARLRGMA